MVPETASDKPLSEVGRITGVFVDPKRTFSDVLLRPRWWVPVLLITICSIAIMGTYSQHVGWERMIRQGMDQSSRTQNMTPEQREQAVQMSLKVAPVFAWAASVIMPALAVMICAGVLMFVANALAGTQLKFGQMCGIVGYSFLTGLVSTLLTLVVMFSKSPDDFNLQNPLAFNLGAYLNTESTPKWLMSIATSIDLFTFWTMALIAIGITCAGRKISFGKALGAVVIPWLVYVLGKAGWAALFS